MPSIYSAIFISPPRMWMRRSRSNGWSALTLKAMLRRYFICRTFLKTEPPDHRILKIGLQCSREPQNSGHFRLNAISVVIMRLENVGLRLTFLLRGIGTRDR